MGQKDIRINPLISRDAYHVWPIANRMARARPTTARTWSADMLDMVDGRRSSIGVGGGVGV
jgi:hypothetical protein